MRNMKGVEKGRRSPRHVACRLLFSTLFLMITAGCQPDFKSSIRPLADIGGREGNNTPRLTLFLNLNRPDGPNVRLQLISLEISAGTEWLPVLTAPMMLDTQEIGDRQLFLGSRMVPLGYYGRVRLTLGNASLRRDDGNYADVSVDPVMVELTLPSPVSLGQDDSRLLLLNWDVQASLQSEDRHLRPVLTVGSPVRQLPVDLVYVSCPDIDTIFVVRSDKNWVVDSFGLKGQPTYLYLDPDSSRQRLTVLASSEATIKILDLSSQRIMDSFRIPLTKTPSFMTISPDGLWAYVLDERNSYLSRVDLLTGRLAARVHTNYRPQYATYLEDNNLLVVSSALSQTVSLHDPLSLAEIESISTGSSPDGLLVSNNLLLIAESGANTVSVYDLSAHRILTRLSVGLTPRRLLDNGTQVYISNQDEGSISVVLRGQLAVGREITGLGRPLEMTFSQTYNQLYVSDDLAAGVAVIDTTTDHLIGYINLGARPVGLASIQ